MMGRSFHLRAAGVGLILYYWWQRPGQIVAKTPLTVTRASGQGLIPPFGAAGKLEGGELRPLADESARPRGVRIDPSPQGQTRGIRGGA
jgi:hypothetical protein